MKPAPRKLSAAVLTQSLGVARIQIVGYVRAGRGVAFLPVPVTVSIAPPGVAFVLVHGIPPGQVVLAWDADRPAPAHRRAAERRL